MLISDIAEQDNGLVDSLTEIWMRPMKNGQTRRTTNVEVVDWTLFTIQYAKIWKHKL